jgi:RNase P/RNase MRP subunit POP5
MGMVVSPEDALRRRRMEVIAKDLNPALRDSVLKILGEWQGASSKEKLLELLGEEEGKRVLREMELE